jgi:hypothetical protein
MSFTRDSAGHAMLSTTSSLVDTELVSRLAGNAAWRWVKHKARQGIQHQGGKRLWCKLQKPLKKLYLLGTYTTRASLRNLRLLQKKLFNFWLKGV